MLLALLVWLLAIAVAILFGIERWWFPQGISAHARAFDHYFRLTLALTGTVFVLAQVFLGWLILKNRSRRQPAVYSQGNNRLEFLWTAAAVVLFVGVAVASAGIWSNLRIDEPSPAALRVEALGKQFAWSFRYPGADGKFGRTDIRFINDSTGNPFGLDERDAAAKDDIVTSALRVPAGKPVVLLLKARDVIHNFFVRELRIKQDLVPGMEIPLAFTADKPGTYEVACSELCGLGHHQMRTTLIVLEPSEFDAWLGQMAAQLEGAGQ
jgi:cytochrome c oxidase subunit 2